MLKLHPVLWDIADRFLTHYLTSNTLNYLFFDSLRAGLTEISTQFSATLTSDVSKDCFKSDKSVLGGRQNKICFYAV